jgi:hypothetical protein
MKESEYILVIVGGKLYSSKWMKWEIDGAKQSDVNLKFAAVKIKTGNAIPSGLPNDISMAERFEEDKIIAALNKAKKA